MTEKGRCDAIAGSGGRCRGVAIDSSGLCHAHHPDRAEARSRAASKGGRRGGHGRAGSGTKELSEIKGEIRDAIRDVRAERVERGIGAVVFQGYNTLIRALDAERRQHEQEVLEARLDEIEERLALARKAEDDFHGSGYG